MLIQLPIKKYEAKPGSRMTNAQAGKYGLEIDRLLNEVYPEGVTPADLVREACIKASPLHDWFTWHMHDAAQIGREHEAREMVRWIITTVVTLEEEEHAVRAFHTFKNGKKSRYVSVTMVSANPDMQAQVIQNAYNLLKGWTERFALYRNIFGDVFDAFDDIDLP